MPIVLDLILIALLIGVMMHSVYLSRCLKNFQKIHREMTPLLKEHTVSLSQTLYHTEQLRGLIRDANQMIHERKPEVHTLKQDLEFMIDRAAVVAHHLESTLEQTRSHVPFVPPSPHNPFEVPKQTLKEKPLASQSSSLLSTPSPKKVLKKKISPSLSSLSFPKEGKKPLLSSLLTKQVIEKIQGKASDAA